MFKNNLKKFFLSLLIVLVIFFVDRISKLYILNLAETENYVDIYFNSFLNFYLIWNTGIGFGIASSEANIFYHVLTGIIVVVNIVLLFLHIKSKGAYTFLFPIIIGGSLGNLYDRINFYAVPDFIDLHIGNFHWFIFNVADIFITLGIIGLLLLEIFKRDKNYKNEK